MENNVVELVVTDSLISLTTWRAKGFMSDLLRHRSLLNPIYARIALASPKLLLSIDRRGTFAPSTNKNAFAGHAPPEKASEVSDPPPKLPLVGRGLWSPRFHLTTSRSWSLPSVGHLRDNPKDRQEVPPTYPFFLHPVKKKLTPPGRGQGEKLVELLKHVRTFFDTRAETGWRRPKSVASPRNNPYFVKIQHLIPVPIRNNP